MPSRPTTSDSVLVFVHGDCADGFTSAGVLRRRFPDARVVYTHPSTLRAELEAWTKKQLPDRLVLADLSPQASELEAMARLVGGLAERTGVTWIDHHAPQWPPSFEKRLREAGVEIVLDRHEKESGASLSARWTKEADPTVKRIVDRIRLRDAWVDPHDPEARAWTLVALERGVDFVDRLAHGRLEGLAEEGRHLVEGNEAQIQRLLGRIRRFSLAVAHLWGEEDISDAADRSFRAEPLLVFLLRFGASGRVSIRTRAGRPLAAPLAQSYGGGGHGNAAGFTLRFSPGQRMLLRLGVRLSAPIRPVLRAADALATAKASTTDDRSRARPTESRAKKVTSAPPDR